MKRPVSSGYHDSEVIILRWHLEDDYAEMHILWIVGWIGGNRLPSTVTSIIQHAQVKETNRPHVISGE